MYFEIYLPISEFALEKQVSLEDFNNKRAGSCHFPPQQPQHLDRRTLVGTIYLALLLSCFHPILLARVLHPHILRIYSLKPTPLVRRPSKVTSVQTYPANSPGMDLCHSKVTPALGKGKTTTNTSVPLVPAAKLYN